VTNLRRFLPAAIGVVALALLAWGVTAILERLTAPDVATVVKTPPPATPDRPLIAATLFYATPEGDALMPIRREVPFAEGLVAQGRQILIAQLEPPPSPYVSTIPAGTMLRSFYVTDRGDAFVDLSSMTELLTVQAIVHAVTANLPAVQRVQILIGGKEVDTLAGHVDIRRPLTADDALLREPEAAP
jgi:hypothetical protein